MKWSLHNIILAFAGSILAAALLCSPALAADDAALERAGQLKELGLFQGVSETDFDLDRPATRSEAVVMLLRLLGEEAQAVEGDCAHPFTDVPEWADSYLGYAYEHGLVNGVGGGLFNAQVYITLQDYCAILLRALGFGDTPYADSIAAAAQKGLLADVTESTELLRSELVLLSYNALFATTADGCLLWERLADAGVFDRALWGSVVSDYGAWGAGFDEEFEAFLSARLLNEYNFAMAYYNTVTGETVLYNEDAWLSGASTYKLPLNMYLTDCFAEGIYSPEDHLPGYDFTLAEVQYHSIVYSNNPLSESLFRMIGGGVYADYRLKVSKYFDVEGLESNNTYLYTNRFTATCLLNTLKHLYADQEKYATIIDYMLEAYPGLLFKAGITECPVAHKYGAVASDSISNDTGIIYSEEPFLLVVLSVYRQFSPTDAAAFMYAYNTR